MSHLNLLDDASAEERAALTSKRAVEWGLWLLQTHRIMRACSLYLEVYGQDDGFLGS